MISILCLSCNAIFSVVSFQGEHAEVNFFYLFIYFLAGRGAVLTFFDIIYEETWIEMNG